MVGGLALALRELGVRVSGSDGYQYSPMPEILRRAGIRLNDAWSADNLPASVDAVLTGALLFRGNPELEAAMDRGVPVWNSTAFLEHYFLRHSRNFVIAGTKGKTTTTAMLAWILERAGLSPDYLIGGQTRGALQRVKLKGSAIAVLEGDEYWCGLGDPMPKFLRYHPRYLIVTNVSYDHHEIYATPALYEAAFKQLADLVPRSGRLVLNADDAGAMALAGRTPTPVQSVGFSRRASHRITGFRETVSGTSFRIGAAEFRLMLPGRMNALDAALAAVMSGRAGIPLRRAARALQSFPGVEGRLEVIGRAGRTVIYADEAYHPIAVRPLLDAVRKRHPGRRILFMFEPRYTGGRHGLCQRELPESLARADVVIASPSVEVGRVAQAFNHRLLCRELSRRGVKAVALKTLDDIVDVAPRICRDGDVIVVSFSLIRGALAEKLSQAVRQSVPRPKGTHETAADA